MNIYYPPSAVPFWRLPLRQHAFKVSRIAIWIALAIPLVPTSIFLFVTGLQTRSFKMSVYNLRPVAPFRQLTLRQRVFRVCRVVVGVTLVLPLVSICIFTFVIALPARSFTEITSLVFSGVALGYFSVAGTLILVWRPTRPTFDHRPPSAPPPSSVAGSIPKPTGPKTPLIVAATELQNHAA